MPGAAASAGWAVRERCRALALALHGALRHFTSYGFFGVFIVGDAALLQRLMPLVTQQPLPSRLLLHAGERRCRGRTPRAAPPLPGLAAPLRPLVLVAAGSGAGARGRDESRAGAPVQRKSAGRDLRPPPPKPPPPAASGAAADPG